MSKKCLIYETYNPINEMKVSKSADGLMTLSGCFGVCGVRNNNSRVYEAHNYGKMVTEMQKRIKENGGIPGELEHPSTMNICLENISHKVTDININEDGVVSGTIQLLNTPKGKIAQAIVEGHLPLYVSSRAMGQVDKNGNVTLEKLQTYDLVGSPGFSQAKMHLNESQVFESLGDNTCAIVEKSDTDKDNTITTTTVNENNNNIEERLKALEDRIEVLEQENEDLQNQLDEAEDNNKDWFINEVAPKVQEWIENEFGQDLTKQIAEGTQSWIINQYSAELQKWIVENYGTEIQKWIIEQYSPNIEKWVLEEVCPNIQNWLVEQYSPEIENWMNENFKPQILDLIKENMKGDKNDKLKNISDVLGLLESMEPKKPVYPGSKIVSEGRSNDSNEPLYIREMPEDVRPKYNMASKEVKENIQRRSKLYDFTVEGAIDRFWHSINFEDIKPVTNMYEGLENIPDIRERAIRAQFRKFKSNL